MCRTKASGGEKEGHVSVEVSGGEFGLSSQTFSYQVHPRHFEFSTFIAATVGEGEAMGVQLHFTATCH